MADTEETPVPGVHNVSVKLPVFWAENAEVWFAQADAQFAIKQVTRSATKFYHCVAALAKEDAAQIIDLIRAPPALDPYETLKRRLVQLYELNGYQRFEALLSLPLASDQKPSNLMNRMLALLPEDYKVGFIFRGLFLRRLPSDIRTHLLQDDISDPRALALKADELFQSFGSRPVSSLFPQDSDVSLELFPGEVNALRRQKKSSVSGSRSSSGSKQIPSSSRSNSRRPAQTSSLCWYHRAHGENAEHCRQPCSWVSEN